MTVYNKLKLAILAVIATQSLHAITIDPIQIQSSPGDLLYAEIHFRNADPNFPVQATLASAEDLLAIGATHRPPGHLNFFTRRDGEGKGVITITSTRPLTESELNVIVKIQTGNASRLQHIKQPLYRAGKPLAAVTQSGEKPLVPIIVRNEQDIGLNLPESTHYKAAPTQQPTEKLLNVRRELPPPLQTESKTTFAAPITLVTAPTPVAEPVQSPLPANTMAAPAASNEVKTTATPNTTAPTVAVQQITSTPVTTKHSLDPLVQKYAASLTQQNAASVTTAPEQTTQNTSQDLAKSTVDTPTAQEQTPPSTSQVKTTHNHRVQANESLWKIASRVAQQENRALNDVMQEIKDNNQHAFIQGDINRLRLGATLNLNTQSATKSEQKHTSAAVKTTQNQASTKMKYRLNQAEMSLVAENEQDSAVRSANKNTQSQQTSKDLSLKVMTAREKTVKLQKNVTQLELALNQKDQRIQVLNARLAQLQEQLAAQQANKKPNE